MNIYNLKTEHLVDPVGIDAKKPRFSWKIKSEKQNVIQKTYNIKVFSAGELLWDSGIVCSQQSQNVRYEGKPLKSGQEAVWNVAVAVEDDTAVSDNACFEMGILSQEEWAAKWIEAEEDFEDKDTYHPALLLRKSFYVKPGLKKAGIYQSAHGLYEFWINGMYGTEDKFKPGFTSYYYRIQYQTYNISNLLHEGENIWSVKLGDGWWRGIVGGHARNDFGYKLAFIGQIILDYEDGSREIIGSDETFKASTGGLILNDMKAGDVFDAALEPEGWQYAGYKDEEWKNVHLEDDRHSGTETLIAARSVPVREKEQFIPKIFRDVNGDTILDYGQNIAGYVKMTLRGCRKGQRIRLQHGEVMKDGAFYMGNLQSGTAGDDHLQIVDYICKGAAIETYQPQFSIFGFRYVKLGDYDGNIEPADFIAVAVYSQCEETGDFKCSDSLINQLVANSRWSQKGNFMDVPTDCPTRERSPWTGDSANYCKTATWFMDVYSFFEKWMLDYNVEQMENGKVCNTVPSTISIHNREEVTRLRMLCGDDPLKKMTIGDMETGNLIDGAAGWGDAVTINPYTMYLCYGDISILENQYESARKWVDYIAANARQHNEFRKEEPQYHTYTDGVLDADYMWDTGYHWGEWFETDYNLADFSMDELMNHPDNEVPTAYFYYSSKLVSQMAAVLGKEEDAKKYHELSKNVQRVFNKYLIHEDGSIKKGRQAPNVRALALGIVYEKNCQKVAGKLAEYVKDNDYHLNTGFLATPFILQVLVDYGYPEYAFKILEQKSAPSWLHNVMVGGTTIPEMWNGFDRHESSLNHYSYGAVCNFMFSGIAGIQPIWETPGYKHFLIKPCVGGTLTYADAKYDSIYGTIRSAWFKENDGIRYEFSIPENTTATVILRDGVRREYGSGHYVLTI